MIDLTKYRWIVVNSSGGKDSQTALRQTVLEADKQGVPRDRIVVSHQDLGRMEWPGTRELAEKQAEHYGLKFLVSKYRTKDHEYIDLLEYVRRHGKWPSSTNRFCTADHKRGPGGRILTQLSREASGPILSVFGFRAEESPARSKKVVLARNDRFSTRNKEVWDYLPIHTWTLRQVWDDIKESRVPFHFAYALGMPRLSCIFCIFAPRAALILAGTHNRDLLDAYVEVEQEIGHTFKHGLSIESIRDAILAGETVDLIDDRWNM